MKEFDLTSMVHLDEEPGVKIYDCEKLSYIGFKNPKSTSGKLKFMWKKANHVKSAFKLHTGVRFDDQNRFVLKYVNI